MNLEIIYTTDSAASIISASIIKELLKDQHIDGADTAVFREVDRFYVSDKTDTYLWLGLPPLEAAFTGEARKSFRKAKHYTVNDSTWSNPQSIVNLNFLQASIDNDIPIQTVYEAEPSVDYRYPVQTTKMPLGTSGSLVAHTLYYGPIMRALSQLWEIFPLLRIDLDADSFIFKISKYEQLVSNFYFRSDAADLNKGLYQGGFDIRKHLAIDIPAAYTLVNSCLKDLGEDYNKDANPANPVQHTDCYYKHFSEVRKQIWSQMDYRQVAVVDHQHKEKIMTVLTTRLNTGFWLGRRVVLMSHKYFHNTRHVSYGMHTANNLPPGNKGIYLRNLATMA